MQWTVLTRAAGLAFATMAIAPASAETTPSSAYGSAKTEAILGGAPSRLALILAQQGVLAARAPDLFRPAVATATASPLSFRKSSAAIATRPDRRPDLFGSVALPVERTSLDRRWRGVKSSRVAGTHGAYAAALRSRSELQRLNAVNRYVNARVRFTDDARRNGRGDSWATASETLRRGRGDCEDYAIAKLQMLRAAGFDHSDLYLVVVKDVVRRSDHAVLVVRAAGRMMMLDNGSDRLVDSEQVQDYRPILTFASSGTWTHGYRRSLPTTTALAAADIAPLTPAAR